MSTAMLSEPTSATSARSNFITPFGREDLLDVDLEFPRSELTRRILSFFWRDCCCPTCFSRAPAPVAELADEPVTPSGTPRRLRAWWLLHDGILEESDGPYSERLRPFFGGLGRAGQLWPRYEFRLVADPLAIELSFFQDPLSGRGHRARLSVQPGGRVRVTAHEPWWGR